MRPSGLERHVVIFARRPQLGVGKRRLAADVGDLRALRFARTTFDRLVRTLGRDPRWRLWIAISPDRPSDWVRNANAIPQGRGNIGERMARVAKALPPGPIVILGSDIPTVSAIDVAEAFAALGSADAVFGPAADGGYWLVGLKRRPHLINPFENVRWSSPHALADTLVNLAGRPVTLLRQREDIDDGAALARYKSGRGTSLL